MLTVSECFLEVFGNKAGGGSFMLLAMNTTFYNASALRELLAQKNISQQT